MKTKKKKLLLVIAATFIASALAFVAGIIAIKNIDPEKKINDAVNKFSQTRKGTAEFRDLKLKFFPRPRVILYDVKITALGTGDIFSKKLLLYPKIIPLIRGKIQFSRLICDSVQSTVYVDSFAPGQHPFDSILPFKEIMGKMQNYHALLLKTYPGLIVFVRHGKINFIKKEHQQVGWISDIDARLRLLPGTARVDINCRANLWQRIGLSMDMNFKTMKVDGRLDVDGLKVDNLSEKLLFFQSYRLARLSGDLDVTFKTNGSDEFIGKINGSVPDLEIRKQGHNAVVFHCSRFKGDVSVMKNRVTARLDQIVLNYPQAVLAGRFHWEKTLPKADLEITGSVMDVATARSAALALVGQFRSTQKIFEIVRGGVVPRISFKAVGDTPGELKKINNIRLQGHLIHGKIVIPKQDLHLDEASGEVVLSKGILEGKNIRARMEKSYGKQGKFVIGLIGHNAPYHLEAQIEADLAQLPPVLTRLTHNKAFQNEMMRLSDVSGRATGKLVLGDRKDRIKARVEVHGFTLSTNYSRLPMMIHLSGEKFLYNNHRIDLQNISGTLGGNTVSLLDAVFDWQNAPKILCRSGTTTLMPGELMPWLKSFSGLSPVFSGVDSVKGSIALAETQIDGPLFEPAKWRVKADGKFRNLAVEASGFPGSFEVVYGELQLTPEQLDISNALVRNQDAELWVGSFRLSDYLSVISEIKSEFAGEVAAPALQWVIKQTRLPLKVREDAVWNFSGGEITHCPGEKSTFKGVITVPNGPSLSLDVIREAGVLSINELKVKDDDAEASLALYQREDLYDINFKGNFNGSTMKKLFTGSPLLPGALSGDFKLHANVNDPGKTILEGSVEIFDFSLPDRLDLPVKIQKASLIQHNGIHKTSGSFLWDKDVTFTIDGEIASIQGKTTFDGNLFSDTMDVNLLINRIKRYRQGKTHKDKGRFWDSNIYGDIDIRAGRVKHGNHVWSPVRAHASLLPNEIRIQIVEAGLCGLQTPGVILITPKTLDLDFQTDASTLEIHEVLPCLGWGNKLIEGSMNVAGKISASGPHGMMSLNGNFHLNAKDGRIYRFGLLAKIFSILNVTEIYRGTLPDLAQEGFKYSAIDVDGEIKDAKIMITKALIEGASMDIAFEGEIDYKEKTVDVDLLVAPLKTIDFIVKNTPLVNNVVTGAVLSIPLKVKGDIRNPEVSVLEPPSIGGGLLQILENTVKLPVKIIQPIFENRKEKQNGVENNRN